MKTYCLTLDLKDDSALIAEYRKYHEPANVWPEVTANILAQGILKEEIYLVGNRLVMILQTRDDFSWEEKQEADRANPKTLEWETLMDKYQKPLAQSCAEKKWVLMEKIFEVG